MAGTNHLLAFALAAAVGGCAAAEPGFSPSTSRYDKLKASLPAGGNLNSDGRFVLSEAEQKLDCKKINGIIHVSILQMRDAGERHRPSAVAKAAQKVSSPIVPGSSYGMDPDADRARMLARAEAFNARLAEKGCPTFDLKAELAPDNSNPPAPVKAHNTR
jgi:hypothetical protein